MDRRDWMIAGVSVAATTLVAGVAVVAVGAAGAQAPAALPQTPAVSPAPGVDAASIPPPTVLDADDPVGQGEEFLDDWVDDGRVVRIDQGGDTVSEGQAYGMLLAVGIDSEQHFDEIWGWTQQHLQRPDELLAWRWQNGAVVDAEPASDADLDAARALVLAGERFDRDDLTQDGIELADAIADDLTVETELGRILLPGLWAGESEPYAYNPSYASPVAYDVLGDATSDRVWRQLERGSAAVTEVLLEQSPLPPDWAQVHADGTVDAMPGAAGGGTAVVYSYDANRLAIRYAESCSAEDRELAGSILPSLQQQQALPAVLDLGGAGLTSDQHPLAYLSRSAAAQSDGDDVAAAEDLDRANALSEEQPTYYGRAWTVLAAFMLRGDELGGCALEATR